MLVLIVGRPSRLVGRVRPVVRAGRVSCPLFESRTALVSPVLTAVVRPSRGGNVLLESIDELSRGRKYVTSAPPRRVGGEVMVLQVVHRSKEEKHSTANVACRPSIFSPW